MSARLIIQEQGGRIAVWFQAGGQLIPTPIGEPCEFESPLTAEQQDDLALVSGRLSSSAICGL